MATANKVTQRSRTSELPGFFRKLRSEHLPTSIFLLAILAIVKLFDDNVVATITEQVKNLAAHPQTAVVLAVFPDSTTSVPMLKGLGFLSSDDIPLQDDRQWILRRLYEGNTPEATARKIRDEIAKKDQNVVMVVGHERSTTAKNLIEQVYESDSYVAHGGPIPLILPAVTNPELTQAPRDGQRHILRLPASDDRQVLDILNLIQSFDPAPKAVELVVDNGNREYSNYIANALIAQGNKQGLPIVDAVGVDIFSSGFSPDRFLKSNPDTIIFIGMEAEASIFVRRLKEGCQGKDCQRFDEKHLRLVFTDGVAGDSFIKTVKSLLTDGESIYITGPPLEEVHRGSSADIQSIPSYETYARVARAIIIDILKRSAQTTHGVTRAAVLRTLQGMLGVTQGRGSPSFNEYGDNTAARFHIYEVTRLRCTHSHRCPGDDTSLALARKLPVGVVGASLKTIAREQGALAF
ncbi:MAG TPA: hypothetical protein VKS60_04880 [Stellaceae bacterium]|nr:hypothetical protein [Stellaceae bacterium]